MKSVTNIRYENKISKQIGTIMTIMTKVAKVYFSEEKIETHIFRLEAEKLAAECRMKLYRTSVKEDLNVGVVFQHLAENYVNQVP